MLNRLNEVLARWENRNRFANWSGTLAKTLLTVGVTAGATVAGTAQKADALRCNCVESCPAGDCYPSGWWCVDYTNCCSQNMLDCEDASGNLIAIHCGTSPSPMC